MNINFEETFENTDFRKMYSIQDQNKSQIGIVEGYVNKYGELISVVKIFDPSNQQKGWGFEAFKKVFQEINSKVEIKIIKGSWHSGGEFHDFEDGQSSNLKIYFENLHSGKSAEESAMITPTGKWAQKLGFNVCEIQSASLDEVHVNFRKSNAS